MMENNNFSFKTGGIVPSRQNQINTNNINIDYQTTEPNSSNLQDIIQKQKKLYDDIITLSSNLNFNFDLNENHNNLNENMNSQDNSNKISANLNPKNNQLNNEQQYRNFSGPNTNDINLINGEQSKKLDELINKFNYLYSSDNNEDIKNYNINNNNILNEEKEMNIHDYYTINNNDMNEKINSDDNNINISSDNIYKGNKTNLDLNKNIQNKSTDNLVKVNRGPNNRFSNDRKKYHYNKKKNTIIKNTYYTNKNRLIDRNNKIHNFIKPKNKSHSTNQVSLSYKNSPDRKMLNKFYLNKNKDNNQELSTISIKANMVINEFKKTLIEAEKMENELNKSKFSIKSYTGIGANGNNIINTYNNMNLNQTNNNDIINNSYLNSNNNNKNIYMDENVNDMNINGDEFIYQNDIDKIKLQNLVLLKSNQALKNQNKILTHEINSYKSSSIYKDPFSEYDKNLNAFIHDLKTSLEQATQTNQELENIITNTQKENKVLSDKNEELLSNFELAKSECEKMTKENSELKVELENKINELNKRENNFIKLQKEINSLNNIVNNNKNQINYLNSIQESNKVSQKDNEDLIFELKNTIENLQKLNMDNNNEIIDLKNKIDKYKNNLNSKHNEITSLNENINEREIIIKKKDNQINECNTLINEIKNINNQNKNEIQNINLENEKLKNEMKTIKMLLADREKTISAQKNSISFLTKTFNKNMNIINNNINNAMNHEENESMNINKGLKIMVEKMQKEIYELNKKNNKNEKENSKLEKNLNEFKEQYEQIKYDYQLLHQKYIEQNKIIEILKNEFLKRNNDNELQHLTKINFDILGKLKKTENENILKTQQLEQLKKNYEMINNQFIEFTKNNYNTNSNEFSDINNNYENILMDKNKDKNIDIDMNNIILENNSLKIDNKSNIILMDNQNIDENFLKYSNDNYFDKLDEKKVSLDYIHNISKDTCKNQNIEEKNEKININIDENKDFLNKKKETYFNYKEIELNNKSNNEIGNNEKYTMNNINLKTESIENYVNFLGVNNNIDKFNGSHNDNKLNSDRLNKYINNENINYSEDIKEKLTENNYSVSDLKNKYINSIQIQMNNIDLFNNLERPSKSNEYISQSMKLRLKHDKDKDNIFNLKNNINKNDQNISLKGLEINDSFIEGNTNNNIDIKNIEKDKSLIPYPNIFTLKGNKIIGFNLFEKKFLLINPKDMTNGVFNMYISKDSSQALTLNTPNNFYILLEDDIFQYNTTNNTINILTKLLSPHREGGFIFINDELYSLSGKDCLQCEKYSNEKNINIKLPSVNFSRVHSGLCNINNEYLYIFFGNNCDNSIERLNLTIDYISMNAYINNWEFLQINSCLENEDKVSLERFTLFLDDYNNVIILGGNDGKGNANQDIYGLNLDNNEISSIGKIDTSALYIGQNIQLGKSIFAIYDTRNGLHFFNKELDYHEIYNFNM